MSDIFRIISVSGAVFETIKVGIPGTYVLSASSAGLLNIVSPPFVVTSQ